MSAKTRYSDGPIGDIEILTDFLPGPEELALREETVKVTLSLSKASVEFFKSKAGAHRTPYQKMIRKLLDSYVEQQKRAQAK